MKSYIVQQNGIVLLGKELTWNIIMTLKYTTREIDFSLDVVSCVYGRPELMEYTLQENLVYHLF